MRNKLVLLLLFLFLFGCSDTDKKISNEFKIGNISTQNFQNDTKYFLVLPFEWNGKNAANIESIELIKEDDQPLQADADRIFYTFYGADSSKATGVYQREEIGDVEDINGFEVEGESRVVLEVSLKDVKPDSDRRMKIKYSIEGKEKEQMIKSPMIEQLRTEE